MIDFTDKIIVITGATSGIGEETALQFAKAGATLIIMGRREERGLEILNRIKNFNTEANKKSIFIKTDVSKVSDIDNAFKIIAEKFGYIDCAFNNAGLEQIPNTIDTITEEIYDNIINTNVKGCFFSIQHEVKLMLANKIKGSIVNTASISGLIGQLGIPVYNASKHAVLGMTKSLGIELIKNGIRINAVSPGAIDTEMYRRFIEKNPKAGEEFIAAHPIKRLGTSAEIATGVLWLCSNESSFVIGQSLTIDGGYTIQ